MATEQEKSLKLDAYPDAAPLMQGKSVPGKGLLIDDPWHKIQGEFMVDKAAKDGRLTPEQAKGASYLYFPQSNGSLFCGAVIDAASGLVLGTTVPRGCWRLQ